MLDVDSVSVNGGALAAADDDAMHVVGFVGDATANRAYSTLDVQRIARVVAGLDRGFEHWAQVDPTVVADVTGNGTLNAMDAQRLLMRVAGRATPEIPAIPAGVAPTAPGGPDPLVAIGRDFTARPGERITVPVTLDTAAGLESAQFTVVYDPAVLEFVGAVRGSLTGDFQWFVTHDVPGRLGIDLTRMNPRADGQGTLAELTFRVRDAAPRGASPIDLQWAYLNDGRLTLNPAPVPGRDATDGTATVMRPLEGSATDVMRTLLELRRAMVAAGFRDGMVDWGARLGWDLTAPPVLTGAGGATRAAAAPVGTASARLPMLPTTPTPSLGVLRSAGVDIGGAAGTAARR